MVTINQKFHYLSDASIDLHAWFQKISSDTYLNDHSLIHRAAELAQISTKGLTTFYGQPCIEQSLVMAEILLEMRLDSDSIAAAMMMSAIQHTTLSIEDIEKKLGTPVSKLVTSVLQMKVLDGLQGSAPRSKTQLDRLRKLFLAMVSDIRAVLIKLAERTSTMRGIKYINPVERKRMAEETMDIYAPLANRLGIGQLKWELEDTAFHYIDSETYKKIAIFLAERRIDREQRIQDTIEKLKNALEKMHITAKIKGRAKHIYSIYLKASRKHLDYKNIYDYSAVRILVPTLEDCYNALSVVHTLFEHIPEEFDDYISHPKANGYRSIHTAVIGPYGKNLEIQIRTTDMHEEAEHGVAAHWIYKEHKTPRSGYEAKITFLRQLLAWHKDVAQQGALPDQKVNAFLDDTIYAFTPGGDIIDLPRGATPLDFAYHIHSELGHRCRGAKIHNHIVPLTYQLNTGDQVEIITAQHGTPSRDWLNKEFGYLYTARARSKVSHWFKQQEVTSSVEANKTKIERDAKRDLQSETTKEIAPVLKTVAESHGNLIIAGINDLLTRIAKCCKPIPGDAIIGYVTQGRGVSVHREDCNNITSHSFRDTNRIIQVAWNDKKSGHYYVDLQVRASGQQELLKEIASLLANAKIDLITLNSTVNKKDNMIYVVMTIQLNDVTQLKQTIHQMSQLPKVIDVKRMSK